MPASSAKGQLLLGGSEVEFDNLSNKTQTFTSTTIVAGNTNEVDGSARGGRRVRDGSPI